VTGHREAALREKLCLRSLREIDDAIALLREMEAVETPPLPFAVIRHVLQEIDHRFEGEMVQQSSWSRVGDLAPSISLIVDAFQAGDRDTMFVSMNDLISRWRQVQADIG
jgi:hypothetical protein